MYKAASRKISIFLTGFILLAWVAIAPPSLCVAGMNELSDGEMSQVYGTGFSSFTLDGTGLATLAFNGVSISTYTTIGQMAMGYYDIGSGKDWDNNWTGVSLGNSSADPLIATGLYIKAQFSNVDNSTSRTLDWVQIGATSLKGTISADFNKFSGTIPSSGISGSRITSLNTTTITSDGTSGFNLTLSRTDTSGSGGYPMGFTFNFGSGSTTP
jgi:hypothetical protein